MKQVLVQKWGNNGLENKKCKNGSCIGSSGENFCIYYNGSHELGELNYVNCTDDENTNFSFKCSKCGCDSYYEEMKGPHLGVYCSQCKAWNGWKKHSTSPKTKEDYKNEYLDKQSATNEQVIYIRNLLNHTVPSKRIASEIIKMLGGEHE